MELKLFYLESVHENAARYCEQAKEGRQELEGLENAIRGIRQVMEYALSITRIKVDR